MNTNRYENDMEMHSLAQEVVDLTSERNGAYLEADRLRQTLNHLKRSVRDFTIENGRLTAELSRKADDQTKLKLHHMNRVEELEARLKEAKDREEAMRQIALTWEAKVLDLQDELNGRRPKPVRFVQGENIMSFKAAANKDR
jgi:chromosome segregation ATPase